MTGFIQLTERLGGSTTRPLTVNVEGIDAVAQVRTNSGEMFAAILTRGGERFHITETYDDVLRLLRDLLIGPPEDV